MLLTFSLQNETALITGGGSGLGFGIAKCFIEAGARVVIAGRREETLREAAAKLGEQASYLVADVSAVDEAADVVRKAEKSAGAPISILINNAGQHLKKPAMETSPEEFEAVMRTHVTAGHALSTAVLPGMLERGQGNILFTASMASFMGLPNVIAYTAAKSAQLGVVRALAAEVSRQGVRVNAIAPGWIRSPILEQAVETDPARKNKILSRTPMGRFGEPEDIGWAAVYLCSQAARFVTGVVLPVDGGALSGF